MKVINGGVAFLEATSLDAQSPPLSSPDAIFTGSTECLSITRVVIEREMNVGRVQRAGEQQCNAIRGRKRPGFLSLNWT